MNRLPPPDFPILQSGYVRQLNEKIANVGKPTVFIGSSIESETIAERVKAGFPEDKFQVDIWNDGIFGLTRSSGGTLSNMEWLKNFTDIYDFAIFIFVPDDATKSLTRFDMNGTDAREALATRHNVVFEFGMFLGKIGVRRSFILFDADAKDFVDLFFTDLKENLDDRTTAIEVNSDFRIELYPYKGYYRKRHGDHSNAPLYDEESIREAILKIQQQMIRNFGEVDISFLPATTLAFGYFNNFIHPFVKSVNAFLSGEAWPPHWRTQKIRDAELERFAGELRAAGTVRLKMVIPNSIEGARQEAFIPAFDKSVFTEEAFPGLNRSITIKRKKGAGDSGGQWVIYDVPTTLNSSIEAINLLTPHNDIRELLKEKELRNFRKAMEHKLKLASLEEGTENISSLVEFISYDDFQTETQA